MPASSPCDLGRYVCYCWDQREARGDYRGTHGYEPVHHRQARRPAQEARGEARRTHPSSPSGPPGAPEIQGNRW
jgi:hypothetical protein